MHLPTHQPQCRYTNEISQVKMLLTTISTHVVTAPIQSAPIDHLMAQSILDRLGYTLQDLSLDYGNVCIANDDISHQLYYGSDYSTSNLMGYVWIDNDIYHTSGGGNNHRHAECAALELLDRAIVDNCRLTIELERAASSLPDYI